MLILLKQGAQLLFTFFFIATKIITAYNAFLTIDGKNFILTILLINVI